MTTLFVTRHPGAIEWAARRGIGARLVAHLDPAIVQPGDIIMGTLPLHVAAEACARGARFKSLEMDLRPEDRDRDLTAEEMEDRGARLEEFFIKRL
jgi:CRISPR-associated protein Csx16